MAKKTKVKKVVLKGKPKNVSNQIATKKTQQTPLNSAKIKHDQWKKKRTYEQYKSKQWDAHRKKKKTYKQYKSKQWDAHNSKQDAHNSKQDFETIKTFVGQIFFVIVFFFILWNIFSAIDKADPIDKAIGIFKNKPGAESHCANRNTVLNAKTSYAAKKAYESCVSNY